jgi:hypothetical protein
MTLVSIRKYAASRGVSHTAVNKAVKRGKISLVNGQIDPEAADAAWKRNKDSRQPSKLAAGCQSAPRDRAPVYPPPDAGAESAPRVTVEAEPQPHGGWLKREHAVPEDPDDFEAPPSGSLAAAQLIYAVAKGRRAELDVAVLEGKLISADEVRAAQTERATAEREALLNWPSSGIAAQLAARFGANEREMFLALDAEVRLYLEARSQQPLDAI